MGLVLHVNPIHICHLGVYSIKPVCFYRIKPMVLILPVAHFLGFLGILGGAENSTELPLFHGIVIFCLLSSLNAWIFCLSEGRGLRSSSRE